MRARVVLFTALATVATSVALVGLSTVVSTYERQIEAASQPEDGVYVVVAARDLYQGVEVTEQDLYAVEYPASELPDRVFLTPEHVVGRVPRDSILANELVRAERLAQPDQGLGLHAILPRGQRALSVDLDGGQALQGVLEPGSYVDVLVTVAPDDGGAPQTQTLLQAVYVLGVDSRLRDESHDDARDARGTHRPSVTLMVSSEQAETVAHARQLGSLRLVLRSGVDRDMVPELTGVRCGLRPCPIERVPEPVAAPTAGPACVEVRRVEGDRAWVDRVLPDGTPCP